MSAGDRETTPLVDVIRELTDDHPERTRYEHQSGGRKTIRGRRHEIIVPSLLFQLQNAKPTRANIDVTPDGYESKPTLNVDALDTYDRIKQQASSLLLRHNLDTTGIASELVRRLHPIAYANRGVEAKVRSWHTQARVVTGWDEPALRPNNTCPFCDHLGGLRVHRYDEIAACIKCHTAWDERTIGLLSNHIAYENTLRASMRRSYAACYCPLPKPDPATTIQVMTREAVVNGRQALVHHEVTVIALCPTCGSSRCHRILTGKDQTSDQTPPIHAHDTPTNP